MSTRKLTLFSAKEVIELAQNIRQIELALDSMNASMMKLGVALDLLQQELRRRKPKDPPKPVQGKLELY